LRRFTEVLAGARDDRPDLTGFGDFMLAERAFNRLPPIQHPAAQPTRKVTNKRKTVCKTKFSMAPVGRFLAV